MSNLPLRPLVWGKRKYTVGELSAQGAGIFYTLRHMGDHIQIDWHNQVKGTSDKNVSYKSFDGARDFVDNKHYPHFMSDFVADDTIDSYFDKFTGWATDRQIIQNGNVLAQGLKLVSEIGELADNLAKGRCIKDDIGDCMVVLNNLAHMTDTPLEDCLAQAWNDIKDRKGTMNEHGVFIKDGDTA